MDNTCGKLCGNTNHKDCQENENWWANVLKKLENYNSFKLEDRLDLLFEVLPQQVYFHLLKILNLQSEQYEKCSTTNLENFRRIPFIDLFGSNQPHIGSKTISKSDLKKFDESTFARVNPFEGFFKCCPRRVAAAWREDIHFPDNSLASCTERLTEKIADKFIKLMLFIREAEDDPASIKGLKGNLEGAPISDIETSVKVKLQELTSVPDNIADLMDLSEKGKYVMLHTEFLRDQVAAKRKRKFVAFGRRLPPHLQVKPISKINFKKSMDMKHVPKHLETMTTVWKGITHLYSTRSYCEHIYRNHSEILPPKFLVDNGMMNPQNFPDLDRLVLSKLSI